MKVSRVLSFIWQLPQNLLGLFLIWFWDGEYEITGGMPDIEHYTVAHHIGVSLGWYIITNDLPSRYTLMHEDGHRKQSKMLGPLYLIVIGIPSGLGNLWDRFFHKKWTYTRREVWYYSLPWESWADSLGGVQRWR